MPSQALMSLFVLSSKDGWVNIMYDGLDAVGIDQQVDTKYPKNIHGELLKDSFPHACAAQ